MSGPYWQDQFNPVRGCTEASPGCAHCYARAMHDRFHVEPFSDVRLLPEVLSKPLRRRKPTTYFVCNTSDLFHPSVSDEFIAAVFGVMAACPQHTFLVLTKRAERMREWFRWVAEQLPHLPEGPAYFCTTKTMETRAVTFSTSLRLPAWPISNLWLGVTAEDQQRADERIPHLLATPAAHRWVSVEPMLGPIEMLGRFVFGAPQRPMLCIDQIIVGGESGPKARPYDLRWARDIIGQCYRARVPIYHKQIGSCPWCGGPSDHVGFRGANGNTESRSGADPSEWPEDLRVRGLAWSC